MRSVIDWILERVIRHPAIDGKRFHIGGWVGIVVTVARLAGWITVDVPADEIAEAGEQIEGIIHMSQELWSALLSLYALAMGWFVKDTKALRR